MRALRGGHAVWVGQEIMAKGFCCQNQCNLKQDNCMSPIPKLNCCEELEEFDW